MSRNLLVVLFSASIFSGHFSFAANLINLDALVNNEISLHFLLRSGFSVDDLLSDYWKRQDLNDREKKQFLKKYKGKINSLFKKESFINKHHEPAGRRPTKPRNFKNFFGNADQAANADAEQLEFYDVVGRALVQFRVDNILSKDQSEVCLFNIKRLRHLHANNYQISQELAHYGSSQTYGKKPALHFEDKDLSFELKAGILFDTLKKAYIFAERRQLLPEMFSEFAEAYGCLEARFARLSRWHREQSVIEKISSPDPDDKKSQTLEVTAQEAVNFWMHAHIQELDAMPEIKGETRKGFVKRIHQAFGGAEGCDGQRITPSFIQKLFERVLFLTPEPSFDSTDSSYGDAE